MKKSKFERHFNRAWGLIFSAMAVIGLIAIITGHYHHGVTMGAGILMATVCFKENMV